MTRLWDKGATLGTYRIGFLQAEPNSLAEPLPAVTDPVAAAEAGFFFLGDSPPIGLLTVYETYGTSAADSMSEQTLSCRSVVGEYRSGRLSEYRGSTEVEGAWEGEDLFPIVLCSDPIAIKHCDTSSPK